eukprot:2378120-Alexandrium_andersonii.AAC.1
MERGRTFSTGVGRALASSACFGRKSSAPRVHSAGPVARALRCAIDAGVGLEAEVRLEQEMLRGKT